MLNGILLSICTGLCWTCIGIVLSCGASQKLAIIPYSFLHTLLTGLAFLFLIDFQKFGLSDFVILMSFVFSAGLLNSFGQFTVHNAMKRGNHAPVWAISQSALIFPFLTGVLLFHNHGSAGQWLGTALITAGILVPAMKDIRNISGWFFPALTAFVLFGAVQVLYGLPAQLYGFQDAAGARPLASIWGGNAGWLLIAGYTRTSLRFDRKLLLIVAVMVVVQMISLRLFFVSLDALAAVNCGNLAFPLMTGANISGFAAYSMIFRREKTSRMEKIGFCMVLAGLLFISL